MPVHNWSRVAAGIFHDFHHEWISAIKRCLNHGLLPADYYALAERIPPSPRDPQGIHRAIWDELLDNDFTLPPGRPLTLAAYIGGPIPEVFVNTTAVGMTLPGMPLFLTPNEYVPLPLEATYQSAWEEVPAFWQKVLTNSVAT